MIKAVIFDFDMTLVDSSHAITEGMNFIARAEGLRELTREEVMTIIGMPIAESWKQIWGRFDERWLENYRKSFKESEYRGIKPFPGTAGLLDIIIERKIRTGVASNRSNVIDAVEAVGLGGIFSFAIGLQDVENGKPAPDMVLKGMDLLQVLPGDCIYVGDTCADMESACAAGVRGVGMLTGNSTPDDLRQAGAWEVLEEIGDLVSLLDRGTEKFAETGDLSGNLIY